LTFARPATPEKICSRSLFLLKSLAEADAEARRAAIGASYDCRMIYDRLMGTPVESPDRIHAQIRQVVSKLVEIVLGEDFRLVATNWL